LKKTPKFSKLTIRSVVPNESSLYHIATDVGPFMRIGCLKIQGKIMGKSLRKPKTTKENTNRRGV
jgi:hypothetical protein